MQLTNTSEKYSNKQNKLFGLHNIISGINLNLFNSKANLLKLKLEELDLGNLFKIVTVKWQDGVFCVLQFHKAKLSKDDIKYFLKIFWILDAREKWSDATIPILIDIFQHLGFWQEWEKIEEALSELQKLNLIKKLVKIISYKINIQLNNLD